MSSEAKENLIAMAIVLILTSPLWLWILGMALDQEWMLYPIALCLKWLFILGGYTS